jgi:phosphate transport system protein
MTQHEHIVKSFDSELKRLYLEINGMGDLALQQLGHALDAVNQRSAALADQVIAADQKIDALEQEVGQDVLRLLALRQPMARDLREVYGALKVSADIERIGDYAKNIAKRSKVLSGSNLLPATGSLTPLITLAKALVADALQSYREHDQERALSVRERDVELDALYTRLFREVLTYMAEDPRQITPCTHLLFMAKNIERIGDHATNIAEVAYFVVTGNNLTEARSKIDTIVG